MTEWTPKQHIEHQKLLRQMEADNARKDVKPTPVKRKKKAKKKKARSM